MTCRPGTGRSCRPCRRDRVRVGCCEPGKADPGRGPGSRWRYPGRSPGVSSASPAIGARTRRSNLTFVHRSGFALARIHNRPDRHGQMLAGGHDGRRPEPVVRRFGPLPTGRAPRLATHFIAFSFRCDSHRFTGCRCGLLGRRDVLAGAGGFCSALKGLLEKQLPQRVGGPGFPLTGGPPVAGGQPGGCLGGAENRQQARPPGRHPGRGVPRRRLLARRRQVDRANSSHPNTTGHQLLFTVRGYRVKGS